MLTRQELLQNRARKCRELAETAVTDECRQILGEIAKRYEREAGTRQKGRELADVSESPAA